MKPVDLEPFQLMQIMAVFFETHAIPYRVVGSLASMAFGEPRFTNDIDIAAELTVHHLADLFRSFPAPEYYLSEPAARDAIRRKAQFNIIHPASGLKVDIFIPKDSLQRPGVPGLNEQIAAFFAKGGKVEVIPAGISSSSHLTPTE